MSFQRPAQPYLLNLNENPLAPSTSVKMAVSRAAELLNYYPVSGKGLEASIASHLGHGLTKDNITLGHGGTDVLRRVAAARIEPGDQAVIPIPTFPLYAMHVATLGGVPVLTECRNDFTLDVEALLGQVTPKTKLMYVTSPNNPSGIVLPQNELDHLVSNLPEQVLLVFDEVYWHFGEHPERARAFKFLDRNNILILHSFSKAFGLAGLRLGYGITSAATALGLLSPNTSMWHNRIWTAAAEASLLDAEHVCRAVELVKSQRTFLYNGLTAQEGVRQVLRSEASFVTFQPEVSSEWLTQELEARNILIRELTPFNMPGWLRVSVGLPAANECFLAALQDALEHWPLIE